MLVGSQPRRVAVIGGARIPFARAQGAYASVGNQEMLTAPSRRRCDRFALKGLRLGDVVAGAVMKHSSQWNLTREALLDSGLVARDAGTRRAARLRHEPRGGDRDRATRSRSARSMPASRAASTPSSDPPVVFGREYQQILLRAHRAKSVRRAHRAVLQPAAAALQAELPRRRRAAHGPVDGPAHGEDGAHLGDPARRPGRARAREPRACAARAWSEGFCADLVVPYLGLTTDNNVRADTSLEKLAKLKPSFAKDGTLTAGNSTPLTDGAAAVLLGSEDWARSRGLPIQAYLSYGKAGAVDFVGGEGLLMAPAYTVPRMLADAGLQAPGLRLLRDPRGLRRAGAVHAEGLGVGEVLPRAARARRRRSARSTAPSSTSRAARSRSATRSRRPARASSRRSPSCSPTRGSGRGLISVCTAGGMGVTAIMERWNGCRGDVPFAQR